MSGRFYEFLRLFSTLHTVDASLPIEVRIFSVIVR
jgi:hypothetical protein